ncbi:Phage repressor protein C, contains Cro/C1-type HTH and peptisase s24 domains [Rhizobium tibeticum]|uniref:Peptidase S24-like protein n=1 Tax=Rhizobium tibeticum TaxID=501024 RepID=A0A1H8DFT9_9HYPH|nr:S24 family peptidase [Rhizobium tibeticum]SEH51613.1 Peptidase S24-like protein [Rhizobium tibeticum]SEN06016.1 Phage repressor protein C, contains Cro/C1-type HTH and peptisase s24 domains [Rhizobium tibeticum]
MTDILKELIAEQGLTWEAAALKSGLERSYFRKLFERGGASPRGQTLKKISDGLGVPLATLLGESIDMSSSTQPTVPTNDVRTASASLPLPMEMVKDVPVMGTAAGSHLKGAFQLSTEPVDYVRRPHTLMNARNVYSLYVEGTSMEPQFQPGDLIYVHPDKPPRFGDAVVIQCQFNAHGSMEATIGILSKRAPETVTIRKHNPTAEIEIPRSTIVAIHKVLSMNEIYGV